MFEVLRGDMKKGVVELDDRLLKKVAEKICEDELKRDILLELDGKSLIEMAEVYKSLKKRNEDISYSKFFVRIRTLTESGLVRKVKPGKIGVGNVVFLELTDKGRKIVELIRGSLKS